VIPPERYPVEVFDEVKTIDIPALAEIEPGAVRVVAEIVAELYSDPWLGQEMRARMRMEVLEHCRKVPFDVPGWKDKPRFRLVYRNDPSDGSIAVVAVLSVGPRAELTAYRQAAARVGSEERQRRREGRG
jgi:hypothetical protein